MRALQRSFEDLGTALVDQEFVVFDLETTGGSPTASQITEFGAVKVRGGEVLGEFATLVNPRVPIPAAITALTGITDDMVARAPPLEAALPAFLEFAGTAAFVAHNASFDTGFLRASAQRLGYDPPPNPVVCTVRLARRLVRDEVPNLRLETLAHAMRARNAPSHRALDDARATTEVFHALLERCGRFGVTHLDDLLWFQSARGHPSYAKVALVKDLPRARGVYLFRDTNERVLYVGKATDLRTRVRSYFSGDDRRRIDDLLRQMERVDHLVCATDLEASVLEARLVRAHSPPFNRALRGRAARWFLRLTSDRFPRLTLSRAPGPGLGPVSSGVAAAVKEALEEAVDVRTCTQRISVRTRAPACVRGQIGRCPAPCERPVAPEEYESLVAPASEALAGRPGAVLGVLARRIEHLARLERYEEAAACRDRVAALADAARVARAVGALTTAGRVRLRVGEQPVVLEDGVLVETGAGPPVVAADGHPDEPRLIAAWLLRNAGRVRVLEATGNLAMPVEGGREIASWLARLKQARAASAVS